MRNFIICSLTVVVMLCLNACNKASYLNVSKQEAVFTKAGGFDTINVECDGSWDVDGCPDWVVVEKSDSALYVSVSKNDTGELREDTIFFVAGELKSFYAISQVGACSKIVPSDNSAAFTNQGGTQTLDIDTDADKISISAPQWVDAKYANGKLTITVKPNELKFVTGEVNLMCDGVQTTIYVTQQGAGCTTCGGTGLVACPSCSGVGLVYVGSAGHPCPQCTGKDSKKLGGGKITCPDCDGL